MLLIRWYTTSAMPSSSSSPPSSSTFSSCLLNYLYPFSSTLCTPQNSYISQTIRHDSICITIFVKQLLSHQQWYPHWVISCKLIIMCWRSDAVISDTHYSFLILTYLPTCNRNAAIIPHRSRQPEWHRQSDLYLSAVQTQETLVLQCNGNCY